MVRILEHPVFRAVALAGAVFLGGCATLPPPPDDGALQREAMAGTEKPAPAPLPLNKGIDADAQGTVTPQISRGTGRFIRPTALAHPRPVARGDGAVTFNFENQPVQAVVKAILGDLLKKNYTIVPGVQGNISFATAEPVDSSQALPILEMLLSWTDNALVRGGDGYVVMKAKNAVAGNLVPGLGAVAPSGGLQARLFPLHYIAAEQMKKLIKPFARPDSVLLVDSARNLLVMAGTPQELANYQRTVRTFDVDWLRGMSVGVFSLEHASVTDLMPKLDAMFGKNGDTPLAGMLRFIPIERTNALVVISTQSAYLSEVGDWIARIDRGGGNQPQLYVYDVRNLKASDMARYLAQIYTSGGSGGGQQTGSAGEVGPGLTSGTLGNTGGASGMSMGSSKAGGFDSGSGGLGDSSAGAGRSDAGMGSSPLSADSQSAAGKSGGALINNNTVGGGGSDGGGSQQYSSQDGSIRISSVDSNNQLLVRARPSQWAEIQDAIKQLDHVPLQVQIETRILEVNLTGNFKFGVQWYLQGLAGGTQNADGSFTPGNANNPRQGALGYGGNTYVPGAAGDALFYSFVNSNLQVALHAMETSGNTKTLSAPSMVVMNNQTAHIQVGSRVPINQTSVSAGIGTQQYNQVQYLSTGVILNVQPRVNPGGLVYMNIGQQVSQVDASKALVNGNPTISQRELATEVAVQSGQTVLLGGLIQQDEGNTDSGVPGLNRIPLLGRLFGTTSRSHNRTELIVLITPRVISNSDEARQITEEYQQKFESLAPLRAAPAAKP